MIVYLTMLTFICFLALGSLFLPKRLRIIRDGMSLLGYGAICVFIGLRDHVGADWDAYKVIFHAISKLPLVGTFFIVEPLYGICNRLVYLAGGDIHIVNLICATILLACLFNFSRLVEIDSNLLLFIATPYLLFVVGMGYTRESVALGLALNAVGYLRHSREKMFYLFAGLAVLFHYSAIFLVLLWWISSFKRTAAAAVALLAVSPVLVPLLFSERYVRYLNNNAAMQSHGVWTRILLIALALTVMFVQKFEWARETELRRVIIRGIVALGAITILSLFLSTLADRICLYLFFIYMLGIGSMIRYSMIPFKYLSIFFVVCLTYGIFFAWFGLSNFAVAWFPYGISLSSNS
ncbi:MAG TPA: EpsG family protein [Terracidiphilus sp.]|jgi:hypothetical protein